MDSTSISLLERLRSGGQPVAWERFSEIYSPLMYRWSRQQGLPEQDAADLVQDVFRVLIVKMPSFVYDREKSFRSWLRRIMVNKIFEHYRGRKLPVSCNGSALETLAEDDPLDLFSETEFRREVMCRALQVMKADFSETTRLCFWKMVFEQHSAADVATELGITVGAVYAAKSRVTARLRSELAYLLE